jgi:hypothetical protein
MRTGRLLQTRAEHTISGGQFHNVLTILALRAAIPRRNSALILHRRVPIPRHNSALILRRLNVHTLRPRSIPTRHRHTLRQLLVVDRREGAAILLVAVVEVEADQDRTAAKPQHGAQVRLQNEKARSFERAFFA